MKRFLIFAGSFAFFVLAHSAEAQTMTWLQAPGSTVNLTNILSTNQVMEVLTTVLDPSMTIDVSAQGQTLKFGVNGTLPQPSPFVIAGPATVVFRKDSAGGSGAFITYRLSMQPPR